MRGPAALTRVQWPSGNHRIDFDFHEQLRRHERRLPTRTARLYPNFFSQVVPDEISVRSLMRAVNQAMWQSSNQAIYLTQFVTNVR
jgi:hypothetical protein